MNKREVLNSISNMIEVYSEHFIELGNTIVEEKVSNYPIFVFQKPTMSILGKQIIGQDEHPESWNVFVTHLEELFLKKIIAEDKLSDFQFTYKENNDKFCILSIPSEKEFDFVFIPKPKPEE